MERNDERAIMREPQTSRRFQPLLRTLAMCLLTVGIFIPNRLVVIERYDECVADRPGFIQTIGKRANGTFEVSDFRRAEPGQCTEQSNPPEAQLKE